MKNEVKENFVAAEQSDCLFVNSEFMRMRCIVPDLMPLENGQTNSVASHLMADMRISR